MTPLGSDGTASPLVQVTDLAIQFPTPYGIVSAVDGIEFAVRPGETLGLVGESGSGKSVTALALLGMLSPGAVVARGSIRFLGQDVLTMPDGDLRHLRGNDISAVFQDPMTSLNPVITVREQVEEVIRAHAQLPRKEVRRRAEEALRTAGMQISQIDDYPHRFSGGMRQRVTIAIAIANRPKLIVADEPTTALDVTIQAQVLRLLSELNRTLGTAVILISHNLGVVAEVCQRVLVMYAGQIMEQGPIDRIFKAPEHPYTLGLIQCMPRLTDDRRHALTAIDGRPPELSQMPPGCPFNPRCPVRVDRCSGERPPKLELAPGHSTACWVAQEHGLARVASDSTPRIGLLESLPRPALSGNLVELQQLTKHFPVKRQAPWGPVKVVHAIDGVDLEVLPGTTMGLVGESGCGKSTLARVLLGAYPATSGRILFQGCDITRATPDERRLLRRKMQMIFQDPYSSLDPRMTVAEIVGEPLLVHGIARGRAKTARVRELLEVVGLSPYFETRYPHEFSGGQRQRIGIARALAVQPPLVVCDEPLSALDVSVQAQIVNLLRDLQRQFDLTYLLISHDLAVVRHMSEAIAVMYLGQIVERGASEEICARPLHPYTVSLLAAVPEPARRSSSAVALGDLPSLVEPPGGCRFHTRCQFGPLHHPERSICREVQPELKEYAPSRFVACHFTHEMASRKAEAPVTETGG